MSAELFHFIFFLKIQKQTTALSNSSEEAEEREIAEKSGHKKKLFSSDSFVPIEANDRGHYAPEASINSKVTSREHRNRIRPS